MPNLDAPNGERKPFVAVGTETQYVVLTRKRWDTYFAPTVVVVWMLSVPIALLTERHRFLVSPLGIVVVWLIVRQLTPANGMKERTIRSTPGVLHLLGWLAFCEALLLAILFVEPLALGQPFAPMKSHQTALSAVTVAAMIVGAGFLGRRYQLNSHGRDP